MAWLFLLAAGTVEIAWALSIEPTNGFTRLWPTALCFVLGASSVYLLTHSLDSLPIGTAYAVFTGIGAVGTITIGILLRDEPASFGRLIALGTIISGIIALRLLPGA